MRPDNVCIRGKFKLKRRREGAVMEMVEFGGEKQTREGHNVGPTLSVSVKDVALQNGPPT